MVISKNVREEDKKGSAISSHNILTTMVWLMNEEVVEIWGYFINKDQKPSNLHEWHI